MEFLNTEFEKLTVTKYIDGYVLEMNKKRTDPIPTIKYATEKFSDLILLMNLIKEYNNTVQ